MMYKLAYMLKSQVYLTEMEKQQLSFLAKKTGKSQSALIREAIDLFIIYKKNRKKAIQTAAGIWKNRTDLPDFEKLRREFGRY